MNWQKLKIFWAFTKAVFNNFIHDDCLYRSAALTYTSLLSLVPLMTVGLMILSAVPHFQDVSAQVEKFIFQNFLATSGDVIQQHLHDFSKQAGSLSIFGSIFLLVTSVMLINTIEQAFNHIWHIKKRRRILAAFMLYWCVLTIAPLLMGLGFILTSRLNALSVIVDHNGVISEYMMNIMPIFLSFIVFSWLYQVIPNTRVKFQHAIVGGLFAAICFELAKRGFTLYITHFPTYKLIYGALATIPLFLVWVYLSWIIILFGAQITHTFSHTYQLRSGAKLDGFTHAYYWLLLLWQVQQTGGSLSIEDMIRHSNMRYKVPPEVLLKELMDKGWVELTANRSYMLSVDLSNVSVGKFMNVLPWKCVTPNELQDYALDELNSLYNEIIKMQGSIKTFRNKTISELYLA